MKQARIAAIGRSRAARTLVLCSAALFCCAEALACRSPVAASGSAGKASVVLKIAGPGYAQARGSRLLLGDATWLSLNVTDGATTQAYESAVSSPTFTLELVPGTSYTLSVEAGKMMGRIRYALYTGSASITPGEGSQTLALDLVPAHLSDTIAADSYTLSASLLWGQDARTWRVDLGSATRWAIKDATGLDDTTLRFYVQNEDGSPVVPAVYTKDRLIVEKSQLSAGASTFLVTLFNSSTDMATSLSPTMSSVRDSLAGTFLYQTTLASSLGAPSDITYFNGSLYAAQSAASFYVSSLDGLTTSNPTISYGSGWGIANDGTYLYAAFQSGNVAAYNADNTNKWARALTNASGIAVLGSYAYVSYNGQKTIYQLPKSSGASSSIVAGQSGVSVSADGYGTAATFNNPAGMCSDGTYLYVVDTGTRLLRRIDPNDGFHVTTLAGNAAAASVDGIGTAASFSGVNHISSDGTYVYLTDNNLLRRYSIATGQVDTLFAFTSGYTLDGVVKVGDVFYITDTDGNCIYKVY